jgi:UDP-glucose 4-epimerase
MARPCAHDRRGWAVRIAVTGAGGKLGSATVATLLETGHTPIAIDAKPIASGGFKRIVADLRDLGQTYGALAGADAVIHLAAIPAPVGRPPELVYATNVMAAFNVFEVAATLGIRRVVFASSVSALGFPYQHRWSNPLYLPIDEAHPLLPQDAYGLSKAAGEDIAAAYCRRGAGSAASLRFSTIVEPDHYTQFIGQVQGDPGSSAHLLWSYVDLRDAVHACLLAVTSPFEGHAPMFVTAADTTADLPTTTLLERYFPTVPRRPAVMDCENLNPRWSLLDCTRARETLGFRPEHARPDIQGVLESFHNKVD